MDPQQRLLLDGYAAASAQDAATCGGPAHPPARGVYVGVSQLEYARVTLECGVPLSPYYATGAHLSVTAGRVAFTWGLRGPAIAVDTACSSSLSAAHLAAR
jgi:acyl transferase domain-containing protein